ncbi:DUF4397 domain-containing protein [Amnibacterium flavum]|nr:DUF4397 domain-containing protein [Amnibacterium flavum]
MISSTPLVRAVGAAAAVAALVFAPAAAASATTADTGYVRVAHLSPDTLQVDISLSALAGGTVLYSLTGVGYGGVSNYMALDPGTYAIAMRPAGADPASAPVVEASIDVTAGAAATVIAMGLNQDLETTVIDDDLSTPPADTARVRVFQASVDSDEVDVSTEDGTELASAARFGDVGDYVDVPAGDTSFSLVSGTTEDLDSAALAAGTAQTLFVLDDSAGALTVVPAIDSAAVVQAPVGGVETGGGALASEQQQAQIVTLAGVAGIAAIALIAVGIRSRRQGVAARAADQARVGDRV